MPHRHIAQPRFTVGALLLSCSLTLGARAQISVPSVAAGTEGIGVSRVGGLSDHSRSQFLFHERALRALGGKTIRALQFRRDRWGGDALPASTSNLAVRIQHTTVAPYAAQGEFTRNRPASTPVFQGAVSLPASPAFSGSTTWAAANRVRIPLTRPFAYAAGQHLCIDVEGEPIQPPANFSWPIDYAVRTAVGKVDTLGRGCGQPGQQFQTPLMAFEAGLLAGANLRVQAMGRLHTPGTLMLGNEAAPVALDSIGMAGCVLRITPRISLPLTYGTARDTRSIACGESWLPIPRLRSLLGASFAMQALNLETGTQRSNALGITATNALRLTIAPTLEDPDWTTVRSDPVWPGDPLPTIGAVRFGFIPVMRFEH